MAHDLASELENDHQDTLWKAAWRRLEDAWELLETPTRLPERSDAATRHLAAAEYLAGYAVECLLKVYIIQRTISQQGVTARRWREVIAARSKASAEPDLSGALSHRIERLIVAAELEPHFAGDKAITEAFEAASKWRVSLRYRALPQGVLALQETRVRNMVGACESACRWLRARLQR